MEVPAAVVKAHPHLLLVLENCERAHDAASEGNFKKFMEHLTRPATRSAPSAPSSPSSATPCPKPAPAASPEPRTSPS